MTPRTPSRADSGPASSSLGRAAPYDSASSDREVSGGLNPEPGQGGAVTPATSLTVETTPAASAVGGFSEYQQGFASNG